MKLRTTLEIEYIIPDQNKSEFELWDGQCEKWQAFLNQNKFPDVAGSTKGTLISVVIVDD